MKLSRSRLPSWLWTRMAHLSWHLLPSVASQAFLLCWVSLQQTQSKISQVIISFLNWHYKRAAFIFFKLLRVSTRSQCHKHKCLCRSHLSMPFIDIYRNPRQHKKNRRSSKDLDIVKVKTHPAGNLFSVLLKNATKWRKVMQRYDSVRI